MSDKKPDKYDVLAAELNDNGDTESIAAALRESAAQAHMEDAKFMCFDCREGVPFEEDGRGHLNHRHSGPHPLFPCHAEIFLRRAAALRAEGSAE